MPTQTVNLTLQEDIIRTALQTLIGASGVIPKRTYRITNGIGSTAVILVKGLTTNTITGYAINETTNEYGIYDITADTFSGQFGPFIPLTGTGVGSPVTGDIEIIDTSGGPKRIFSLFNGGTDLMEIVFYDNGTIQVITTNTSTGAYARTIAGSGQAALDAYDGTDSTAFSVQEGAALMASSVSGFKGIEYDIDYSANYINRSLVDKEYVDNAVAGGGSSMPWSVETADRSLIAEEGVIANKGTQLILTLPTTCAVGKIIEVVGINAGLWRIAQNAGQRIRFHAVSSTSGTGGYVESTAQRDTIRLVCIVADTEWQVIASTGPVFNVN